MRALRSPLSSRVHRRLCLSCGYDGPALQGHRAEATYVCPNCGEDLYARPPRSYAEMEGFDEEFEPDVLPRLGGPARPARLLDRLLNLLRRSLPGRR